MTRLLAALAVLPTLILTAHAQDRAQLTVGASRVDVVFAETPLPALRAFVLAWIATSAQAVATYHERFPVARVEIRVRLRDGRGPSNGTTYGWNGALITIAVGRASTAADFADDWLMPHEMLHLGFPSVPERHHWIEEGISTYVEPIARARAGLISLEEAWGDLVRGLPQGQPQRGDRGLDVTHSWGRTYWGGALFCLLADVEIRKRTANRLGLEHALRAIVQAGGTIEANWKLDRAIEIGDRATGVPVLRELYQKMRASPAPVDLDALWKELGIERQGRKITIHDTAPLAHIRAAITQRVSRTVAKPSSSANVPVPIADVREGPRAGPIVFKSRVGSHGNAM